VNAAAAEGCLACELASGERELPGGRIAAAPGWVVEHCVGPLGVGTLIVKPLRHVTHVWGLSEREAVELGPLLARVARAQRELLAPEQLYVTLWSHSGGVPVHIHWVLQPVGAQRLGGLLGPHLQAAMFDAGEEPARPEVEAVSERLRGLLSPF
jgi:diadenosine tetraphosphate (Ap4A) HIT family hydrolase